MQPLKRLILALAVIFLVPAVMLTGCGGSDGSPTASDPCATFSPSVGSSPGTVTTAVVDASSTCDLMTLDVLASGVNNLHAAGFTVRFPTGLLTFLSADDSGSTLRQGGVDVNTLTGMVSPVAGTNLSEFTVGITRLTATEPGVDIGDTAESMLQLIFSRGGTNGTGSLSYVDDELLDDQTPPAQIGGVTWHGGTITIN
jgi:hypothetical protein